MQAQQHIYLQDYKRHSVVVSQRRNGHMQVYVIRPVNIIYQYNHNGRQIYIFHMKWFNCG